LKLHSYAKYKKSRVDWLGDAPEHWEVCKLGHVARLQGGYAFKSESFGTEGVAVVRMNNIKRGVLTLENANRIDPEYAQTKFALGAGDLLFGMSGSIGETGSLGNYARVRQVDLPAQLNQRVGRFLPDLDKLSLDYLSYIICSNPFYDQILLFVTGTAQFNVSSSQVQAISIALPSFREQRAITDFLDAKTSKIDTLIRKKEELIEKLQEKRSALISRTVTRGLPPDAAKAAGLNPNPKMRDSGTDWLGEIPAHWEILPFTKYLADKSDYRGATPEKVQDGIFLVTAKNVRMGYIDYTSSQEYVREEEYDQIMRRGLPKLGDILFTTEAPLGNVAAVDREDIALAQRIIRFRLAAHHFHPRFSLFLMMSEYFQGQLARLSTGSTAEGLKASKLCLLRILKAPILEQEIIAKYLERELEKISETERAILTVLEKLIEYRSTLITAAVTGKIDVRNYPGD
jgi:type I restriction enzyme, S subunit